MSRPFLGSLTRTLLRFSGTGCNSAYIEKVDNIPKWNFISNEEREISDEVRCGESACWSSVKYDDILQVVIDIESGAFGDNGSLNFVKTEFDDVIDKHSNHRGSFT